MSKIHLPWNKNCKNDYCPDCGNKPSNEPGLLKQRSESWFGVGKAEDLTSIF